MMRNEVARGGTIFLGKNISIAVLGLVLTSLIARILSPEKYGIFSIATSLALFFMALFNLGLGQTAVKFISEFRAKKDHKKASRVVKDIIIIRLVFTSVISLSFFLLSDYFASYYAIEGLSVLLKLSSLMIFSISNAKLLWNSLIGFKEYAASSKAQVFDKILSIVLFILFFALGLAEPFYAILAFILSAMFAIYYCTRKLSPFMIRENEKGMITKVLFFAMPLYLTNTLKELQWDFANVVLGFFDVPSNVGLLAFSLKLSGTLLLINKSFSSTFIPLFSQVKAQGKSFKEVYARLSSYLLLFALLSTATMIFFTQEMLWIFGGSQYLSAVTIVQFLAIIPLISIFSNLNHRVFVSHSKTKILFYLSLIRLFLIISLLVVLTPVFLMWGAAIALFLSSFISTTLSTILISRLLEGGFESGRVLRSLVPLALCIPALFFQSLALRILLFILFLFFYVNVSMTRKDISFFSSLRTEYGMLDVMIQKTTGIMKKIRILF